MKTFDIALSHLNYDFSSINIYDEKNAEEGVKKILNSDSVVRNFLADKRNTKSNETYRRSVFVTALFHKIDKAHRKPCFFDVAEIIVDSHRKILKKDFKKYKNTVYPEIMFDGWEKYIKETKDCPYYLSGDLNTHLFITIFHYLTENDA